MGRHKAAKKCQVLPWLSAKKDCEEGRFVQIGNSLLLSEDVGTLSPSSRWLYLCAAMEAAGKREFIFPAAAMKKYHISRSTAQAALIELTERGFIELVSSGKTSRTPNIYSFSLQWKERI